MRLRQLLIFIVIMIILILSVWLKKAQVPTRFTEEEFSSLDISLQKDEVFSIELRQGNEPISIRLLRGEDDRWSLPDHWNLPAKKERIEELIKATVALEGELRARDEALLVDFGIGDEVAFIVRFGGQEGEDLVQLLLGTEQPRFNVTFVRLEGSSDVYLVNRNLFADLGIQQQSDEKFNVKHWTNLSILDLDDDQVERFRIEKRTKQGGTHVTELFKKQDPETDQGQWQFVTENLPFGVEAIKVRSYLSQIRQFSANDFRAEGEEGQGFDEPHLRVTLTMKDKTSRTLVVGAIANESTSARFLRSSDREPVLVFSKYQVQNLDKEQSRFFPTNPLGIDTESLTSLRVFGPESERSADEASFEEAGELLDDVKSFSVSRLLITDEELKKLKGTHQYGIEIVPKEGDPITVQVGDPLDEEATEYAASLSDGTAPFAIKKKVFESLFNAA